MKKTTLLLFAVCCAIGTIFAQKTDLNQALSLAEVTDLGLIENNSSTAIVHDSDIAGTRGTITYYADRASLTTACAGTLVLEDFAGGPGALGACDGPISDAGNSCFPAGEIQPGVVISSSSPVDGEVAFAPNGFNIVTFDVVGPLFFANYPIISFPAGDVTTVALDLFVINGGTNDATTVDVRLFGVAGLLDTVTISAGLPGPVFFGFISPEPILSIEIEDLVTVDAELIGNLEFGNCNTLLDVCGGQYIDSGGDAGNYSNSESITTTINPDIAGDKVTATFTYVDIETATGSGSQDGCWDFLTIYDGPDNTFPVLAQTLCGEESGDGGVPSVGTSLLSVGMSFTSTDSSGALTFVFTSDSSVSETGWVADITCAPSCFAPTALTAANITIDGADLGWTENNASAATMWDVEWGAPGFTPGTGAEVGMVMGTMDNPYMVTGLTDATTYEFYVRAGCSASDHSLWAGPFEFTTEAIVIGPICGGQYVDSGGAAGNYSNSESITTTITPDVGGDVVTATFTYVDIETATGSGSQDGCWDFLTIYDGPDNTFPVLAQTLCGEESGDGGVPSVGTSLLSVGMSFTSTDPSGALTFVFTSDSSVPETGWVADITCAPPVISVDDLETVGFQYFPNPVNNNLTLRANENITFVSIVNLLGQEVKQLKPSSIEAVIDMSSLEAGTYFVRAQINDKTGTFKIIKK